MVLVCGNHCDEGLGLGDGRLGEGRGWGSGGGSGRGGGGGWECLVGGGDTSMFNQTSINTGTSTNVHAAIARCMYVSNYSLTTLSDMCFSKYMYRIRRVRIKRPWVENLRMQWKRAVGAKYVFVSKWYIVSRFYVGFLVWAKRKWWWVVGEIYRHRPQFSRGDWAEVFKISSLLIYCTCDKCKRTNQQTDKQTDRKT